MKTCLIYNYAQHYRADIFKLLEQKLNCDFYFGHAYADVKKLDYSLFRNPVKEVKNVQIFHHIYYQKEIVRLVSRYETFLILGDIRCLSTWLVLMRSRGTGKKVFLWTHGWYGKETWLKALSKKLFFAMADGIFLYGEYAKKLMVGAGIPSRKLHVIHNSLAYDQQVQIRKGLGPSDVYVKRFRNACPNIVFIGRLTKEKKLQLLLEAVKILENENVRMNLTIIGAGSMESALRIFVAENGLENVWFAGECFDEEKIAPLIFNADVTVSPGNVGLTAMHSMVYGTPVITHDDYASQMPEFEAVREGLTGAFFRKDDEKSLAETIRRTVPVFRERKAEFRERCFRMIEAEYNPHRQIEIIAKAMGERYDEKDGEKVLSRSSGDKSGYG